jgi:accessory colonization factor AcfC
MHQRVLLAAAFVFFLCISLQVTAQQPVLRVYGPGGPLGPLQECADLFSAANQVKVVVTASPEPQWFSQAQKDADLIFGGADYMLTDFALRQPAILDEKTRVELYVRPAGILVRKGNPKNIKSIADLARPGVRILDVNGAGQIGLWEDVAGKLGLIPAIQKNIAVSVRNSVQALDQWRADPKLDAWITFESWAYRLSEVADLVRLPEAQKIYRGTPIAIAKTAPNRELAEKFIAFLQTDQAHAVFQKWGWK